MKAAAALCILFGWAHITAAPTNNSSLDADASAHQYNTSRNSNNDAGGNSSSSAHEASGRDVMIYSKPNEGELYYQNNRNSLYNIEDDNPPTVKLPTQPIFLPPYDKIPALPPTYRVAQPLPIRPRSPYQPLPVYVVSSGYPSLGYPSYQSPPSYARTFFPPYKPYPPFDPYYPPFNSPSYPPYDPNEFVYPQIWP